MTAAATNPPRDALNWFEIPSSDFNRAVNFYEKLFGTTLRRESISDPIAIFPSDEKGVGGAIVHRPQQKPASFCTLIYLNADGILAEVVARAPGIGGTIIVPRTEVPGGFGYFACIVDSEGNHIGLHEH